MNMRLIRSLDDQKSDLLRSIDAIETLSTQPAWAERCNVDDGELL